MARDGGFLGWRFWGKTKEELQYLRGTQMTRLGSTAADATLGKISEARVGPGNNFHMDTNSQPRSGHLPFSSIIWKCTHW